MKIIFLDNDGVICLADNWGSRNKKQEKWEGRKLSMGISEIPLEYRFDNFDEKSIKVLNSILEKTDAEIVVSSDWRLYASLEELGEYYESQGIIKRPIAYTEVFHYTEWLKTKVVSEDFSWDRTFSREQERHFEILKWLNDNSAKLNVEQWVAIDDLHMGKYAINSSYGKFDRDWGLSNFVWTPNDLEGIKQSGIKDKILNYLK